MYFECQKQELFVFVNDYDYDDDDDLKHSNKIISLLPSEKYLLKKIFIFHNPKLCIMSMLNFMKIFPSDIIIKAFQLIET